MAWFVIGMLIAGGVACRVLGRFVDDVIWLGARAVLREPIRVDPDLGPMVGPVSLRWCLGMALFLAVLAAWGVVKLAMALDSAVLAFVALAAAPVVLFGFVAVVWQVLVVLARRGGWNG